MCRPGFVGENCSQSEYYDNNPISNRGQYCTASEILIRRRLDSERIVVLMWAEFNPKCAGHNKSRLLLSSAEKLKKPLWQTVWTQIRLLL